MSATQKKVVVRSFSDPVAWGYLPQEGLLVAGEIQLMAVDGRVNPLPINEIKLIAYVRDFNLDDRERPERLEKKLFQGRPRGDGIWVRLTFRDGDVLEGLTAMGLGFFETAVADQGLFLTPPDVRGNTTRIFVPRSALTGFEVLGWVTAPSKRPKRDGVEGSEAQPGLFE
jgi:hypothetical protein